MTPSMTDYYQARAHEYESVYDKPERQEDLHRLRAWLAEEARGRTMLEVACGTGYWTAVAAGTASAIAATDLNAGPLEIARAKGLGSHVRLDQADAFALSDYGVRFDAGMANFWWSHVPIADRQRFLGHFASKLGPRAKLLMIDNNYVEGSSTPISRTDALGNTYQVRQLVSGADYEVLKNFPTTAELQSAFGGICTRVDVLQRPHYWALRATLTQ
jgi:demethylmenaquinone methyltransferase/2-methoxy-6-polyprenyl-1,4-benzoquinol methylase